MDERRQNGGVLLIFILHLHLNLLVDSEATKRDMAAYPTHGASCKSVGKGKGKGSP
jgi:hypothetical protein